MRCSACNAAVSHTLKKISSQQPVSQMHGRKSAARLTELTELTHNRPSSDSFGRRGKLLPRRDGRDMAPRDHAIHQASIINRTVLYCTAVMETTLPFNTGRSAAEMPRERN